MIENRRQSIIRVLVDEGHSPTKALEIAIDLERGEAYAASWLETIVKSRPRHPATTIGE